MQEDFFQNRIKVRTYQPIQERKTIVGAQRSFVNDAYGYCIVFPETWTKRYFTIPSQEDSPSYVEFIQLASHESGWYGRVFGLFVVRRDEFDQDYPDLKPGDTYTPKGAPWEHMLIEKNNQYAFCVSFPSDVQWDLESEEISREYAEMMGDIYGRRFELFTWNIKEKAD